MKNIIKMVLNVIIKKYIYTKKHISNKRNILFFGVSPMNYTMFKPLHIAIEKYSNVNIYFCLMDIEDNYNEYINLGIPKDKILRYEKSNIRVWDSIFMSDFQKGFFRWDCTFIQIYHGVAAKKYTYVDENGIKKEGDYRIHHTLPEYDMVFFINKTDYDNAVRNNKLKNKNSGYIIGMCCLDEMKENSKPENIKYIKKKYIPEKYTNKKIILYAPTWGSNASFHKRGEEIIDALSKKDEFIIIKPHPRCLRGTVGKSKYDLETFVKKKFQNDNVLIVTDTPYEIMPITDMIISDFSSITFEYALLRKPIYLFIGDNISENIADYEQYSVLNKCCYKIYENSHIDSNIFNKYTIDEKMKENIDILEYKYFSNYGHATDVAIRELIKNRIIGKTNNLRVL